MKTLWSSVCIVVAVPLLWMTKAKPDEKGQASAKEGAGFGEVIGDHGPLRLLAENWSQVTVVPQD